MTLRPRLRAIPKCNFLATASKVDEQFAVASFAIYLHYRSKAKSWVMNVSPTQKICGCVPRGGETESTASNADPPPCAARAVATSTTAGAASTWAPSTGRERSYWQALWIGDSWPTPIWKEIGRDTSSMSFSAASLAAEGNVKLSEEQD
jgi:hypothetical protein